MFGIFKKSLKGTHKNIDEPQNAKQVSKMKPRIKPEYYPTAVEISSASIKLLQIARTPHDYGIIKAGYINFKQDALPSEAQLKESLEKLIKENKVSGEIVTSLPLNKVQVFTYILPNMPLEEVESAVAWKLKQNPLSGISFDDIVFDHVSPLRSKDTFSKDIPVLVFVASKKETSDIVAFFKSFSLELVSLEPKPYATLQGMIMLNKIRKDETVLLLQLGASQSSITIVSSGQPYLIRPLAVTGNSLTGAIADYNRLDKGKAEELKRREGLGARNRQPEKAPAKDGAVTLDALSSQLESLIVDIEHTFKYFSHQLMKSQVISFDRIVLCGGTSGMINLDKFLSEKLSVPVEVFGPFVSLGPICDYEIPQAAKEAAHSFASMLGLAVRYIE